MNSLNIHLLLNVGSRRSRESRREIEKTLAARNIIITETHIMRRGDRMDDACALILKQKPDLLIIGGGDGTVSSALHFLAESDIEIGIIPLGTTNNFARSLNLPLSIQEAIDVISHAKSHQVDLGMVNGQHFANVIGVGLSAQIAKYVNDKAKKRWGRLAYAIVGLQQLTTHKSFIANIHDKDNEISFSIETHQIIIANGRYHAGKKIAADAAIDNRELIIFALGGRGWISFAWHTLDYYLGRRKKIVHSSYVVGKDIRIETSRKELIEIDGETGYTTPLAVHVKPKSINVRHYL